MLSADAPACRPAALRKPRAAQNRGSHQARFWLGGVKIRGATKVILNERRGWE
jgi:hypothetical protein